MGATEWGKPRQLAGDKLEAADERRDFFVGAGGVDGKVDGDAGALVGGIFGEDDDAGV
jgi:hypothetical protein